MPTIAIVGAGRGVGLAVARKFGAQGFDVALISRNSEKLARLEYTLEREGITAASFAADVTDQTGLTKGLKDAIDHFGGIDVLEYSPADYTSRNLAAVDVRSATPQDVQAQIEHYLYGGMTAAHAVLPTMLAAGTGTLLFTTGIASVTPMPIYGNIGPGAAALRNWSLNLGESLHGTGIHVAHIAIGVWIGESAPDGYSHLPASELADRYYDLHHAGAPTELIINH